MNLTILPKKLNKSPKTLCSLQIRKAADVISTSVKSTKVWNNKMKIFILVLAVLNLLSCSEAKANPPPLAREASPKIWMNLFLLTADLSQVKVSDLERFADQQAEGFELPGTISTPEDCKRIGAFIRSRHFPAALNVAVDHDHDPSSTDEQIKKAGIDYLISRIDCAEAMGASIVAGPIVLPLGFFPDGFTGGSLQEDYLAKKLKVAKASLRTLADYAKTKQIKLAFEPVTHWEMPGLNTLREAIQFVKEVGHPNFGITLDSSHEILDGEGPAVFEEQVNQLHQMNKLFYIQVSGPHRGDVEKSWLPWKEFYGPIKKVWKGPLTVEIMNAVPPFASPAGKGLRLSRVPFKDPFEIAERSIKIAKKRWSEAI